MTIHVMVDIETLGLDVDTKIISIGAVIFNKEGITDEFYSPISSSVKSQGERSITKSTIEFWDKQSITRPDLATDNLLSTVLSQFTNWLPKENYVIWANGITFDISILSHAYGNMPPWKYNAMRDAKTIYKLFESQNIPKPLNIQKHNALEDAIYQAKYLTKILNYNQLWE